MGEPKKQRRYSVDFEHYENAMLAESRLAWEMFFNERFKMPKERREKFTALLRRFVAETKPELDGYKARVLKAKEEMEAARRSATPLNDRINGARDNLN